MEILISCPSCAKSILVRANWWNGNNPTSIICEQCSKIMGRDVRLEDYGNKGLIADAAKPLEESNISHKIILH